MWKTREIRDATSRNVGEDGAHVAVGGKEAEVVQVGGEVGTIGVAMGVAV